MPNENVQLTSSEIASLWATYMNDSMTSCMLKYFINVVEDDELRPIIEQSLALSEQHLQKITNIYKHENHAIPEGFGDDDVNISAPRLFNDIFHIAYVRAMLRIGIHSYGLLISNAIRKDIRAFFSTCIHETVQLLDQATDVMLKKGLLRRPPYIPLYVRIVVV